MGWGLVSLPIWIFRGSASGSYIQPGLRTTDLDRIVGGNHGALLVGKFVIRSPLMLRFIDISVSWKLRKRLREKERLGIDPAG